MELKTNAFRARFAPEANNFVSLVNLATGDDYIKAAPRGPLVELYALADGENVFYIDVNEVFADENGYLDEEYADGDSHLKGKYYRMWADYIRSNAVVFEMPSS